MDRRRFLKYAAVGAAMAGSALAGYELDRWQNSLVPPQVSTTTLTTTQTLTQTTTETVRLASLYGRLFFDYNGNGVQDGEEPAVPGASVQLKDDAGSVVAQALTDSSGDYKLEDVKAGSYTLHLEADRKFRYICTTTEEFREVGEGYTLDLTGSNKMNIGLMEGFLTLPFVFGTHAELSSYFDHDPAQGKVKNYLGNAAQTNDGHQGIDWSLPVGTSLVASAPGKVLEIAENERGAKYIDLIHSNNMVTSYGHISKALRTLGEWLERGEVVALSGESGSPGQPHIHFEVFHEGEPGHYDVAVDPFRDVFGDSPGYWTKENDPQFPATSA
jgi:murein DD-endopeptidase MepM/ murein hydrolase activator NlpD